MVEDFKKIKKELERKSKKSKKRKKAQKILVKPKAKVQTLSAEKFIMESARHTDPRLSREVEPKEFVEENRSLYFKEEFINEKRKAGSWL